MDIKSLNHCLQGDHAKLKKRAKCVLKHPLLICILVKFLFIWIKKATVVCTCTKFPVNNYCIQESADVLHINIGIKSQFE